MLENSHEFGGKVAFVTGAASGIGRRAAQRLAQAGAALVLADVDEAASELCREIGQSGGRAIFQRTDVSNAADCTAAVDAGLAAFGRLDIAFNNAGIVGRFGRLAELQAADWQLVINVNLVGVINCMAAEVRAMAASGGVIVNNASVMGLVGGPGAAPYSASKHGVVGVTRAAAMEYGRKGIRINALCPGFVRTPMTQSDDAGADKSVAAAIGKTALGRLAEVDEIVDAVLWLCSPASSFVCGAALAVDGGFTAN